MIKIDQIVFESDLGIDNLLTKAISSILNPNKGRISPRIAITKKIIFPGKKLEGTIGNSSFPFRFRNRHEIIAERLIINNKEAVQAIIRKFQVPS
jgi:hypothetical protein